MGAGAGLWAALFYAAVFAAAALRAREWNWLLGSLFLWAGLSSAGAVLMPGLWGMTHAGPLMVPHFYITAASPFFLAGRLKKRPQGAVLEGSRFLGLFAVSNLLMTAVWLLLAVWVAYYYPGGLTPYALPALLQIYAFNPLYWFVFQGLLMAVFYLHRRHDGAEAQQHYSLRQMEAGFLMMLLVMASAVAAEVAGVFAAYG